MVHRSAGRGLLYPEIEVPRVGWKIGVFAYLSRAIPVPGVRRAIFMELPALAGARPRHPRRLFPGSVHFRFVPCAALSEYMVVLMFTVVLKALWHFLSSRPESLKTEIYAKIRFPWIPAKFSKVSQSFLKNLDSVPFPKKWFW